MEQFDQLLTCCVCLDRYRTPKLLPCQHSYCMEPCMEGLVDYVKRQVKCPECRAEHRIPYNGIQGFPTNVTLTKFLDLHAEITGELPDPNADAIMSRCNVCSEKAYVNNCAHCDKKCCDDCREAHCDILKREISRVNNQIRRGWHRLEDCIQQIDRNNTQLSSNGTSVLNDIEEMHTRLANILKERTEFLKSSVEKYLIVESKTLKDTKENLELELANIKSNADLMENHMNDGTKWDDNELMDTKDIFIKMMDFIRNYDPGTEEYTRRIRFSTHEAVNDLAKKLLEVGELKFYDPKPKDDVNDDLPIRSSGLSRSKSDHRLVAEFRRREEAERSPPSRRRFGDTRYSREDNKSRTTFGRYDDEEEDSSRIAGGRFRSRFLRGDDDDESGGNRSSMYDESGDKSKAKVDRVKVVDTEDCSRGPLSGCIRLADSSRVIQRLKEMEMAKIKPPKKKEEPPPIPKFVPLKPNLELLNAPLGQKPPAQAASTEQSKPEPPKATPAPAAPATIPTTVPTGTSLTGRVPTHERQTSSESSSTESISSSSTESSNASKATPASAAVQADAEEDEDEYEYYEYESYEEDEEEEVVPPPAPAPQPPKPLTATNTAPKPPERKTSYSSPASTSTTTTSPSAIAKPTISTATTTPSSTTTANSGIRSYGGAKTMPNIPAVTQEPKPAEIPATEQNVSEMTSSIVGRYRRLRDDSDSFVNKYLAKSRQASVDPSENRSTAVANSSHANSAASTQEHSGIPTKKISGTEQSSGRSRYAALRDRRSRLAKSKSTAVVGFTNYNADDSDDDDDDDDEDDSVQTPFTSRFGRELAKSRSSHFLKAAPQTEDSDSGLPSSSAGLTSDDDNLSSWARYLKNKYGSKTKKSSKEEQNNQINSGLTSSPKQTLLMTFGSRGSQPGLFTWPRGIAVGPDNSIVVADSSNHRVQVFNEHGQHRFSFGCYGNGEGEFDCLAGVAVNKIGQYIIADRYNHRIQIFDASGHFIRCFGSQGTVDGKFSYPWGITTDALGLIYVCDKENHRVQVFQSDGSFVSKFGVMGSKPGHLEHPHYIAVSNTNRVIVSDSNNHRIQIFDANGKVNTTFGSEGTDAGQFKFPRGVSVDEKGYIYVADSGNNRIQIFNPDGTFLRCFGRWGQGEGEFKGLEGIAVNSKGSILVADRENHRVQIF